MAEETRNEQPPFVLGLTMAGAISGGAYAAGVLSFLTEALDAWEKERGRSLIPNHRVVLKAMSGASAGSICAALGVVALADPAEGDVCRPGTPATRGTRTQFVAPKVPEWADMVRWPHIPLALPRLYEAWVKGPCLVNPDPAQRGDDLLGLRDLRDDPGRPNQKLRSVLDSTRLERVAAHATSDLTCPRPRRAWIDPRLHLFMTHTDMRGVPYTITFKGFGASHHGMMAHADRVHYVVEFEPPAPNAAPTGTDNDWLKADACATPLELHTELTQENPVADFRTATLASSAFPVGFAAQHVPHGTKDWDKRPAPIATPTGGGWLCLEAAWKTIRGYPGERTLDTAVWDGGCLDNEPFQYARWAIMEDPPQPNPDHGCDTTRAVVMIDPFPEDPGLPDPPGFVDTSLLAQFRRVKSVFIEAGRFKPDEIAAALDPTKYSRYLIGPVRETDGAAKLFGGAALASGGLGGFGGTLHEAFRLHDFQLGRRNCQQFLREHFSLPAEKGRLWPCGPKLAGVQPVTTARRTRQDDGAAPEEARIIYLTPAMEREICLLPWPRIDNLTELQPLLERAYARSVAVARKVAADSGNWWLRTGLAFALRVPCLRRFLKAKLRWPLMRDLLIRDQICGAWDRRTPGFFVGLSDKQRSILAVLCGGDPVWRYGALDVASCAVNPLHRTKREEPSLDEETFLDAVGALCATGVVLRVYQNGPAYVLRDRAKWTTRLTTG